MASPAIFNGKRTKILTQKGLVLQSGQTIDNDGEKNNLVNPSFETGTTVGWSLFNTTLDAQKVPNGSITAGASGITTFSTVSSGQLAGSFSLSIASSASISAGMGFISDPYTLDQEDLGKPFSFKFSYSVISGLANLNLSGTTSNTFAVYLYDVANSAWVQPSGVFSMTQGIGVGQAQGEFQTSSNATSYRIAVIAINATTTVGIYFDSFKISRSKLVYGVPVTDPQTFSMTIAGSGSAPTRGTVSYEKAVWWRDGKYMVMEYDYKQTAAGSAGSGTYLFTIPNGLQIDTTYQNVGTSDKHNVGDAYFFTTASNEAYGVVFAYSATQLAVNGVNETSRYDFSSTFGFGSSTAVLSFKARVPILGWSASTQMSSDAGNSNVLAKATGAYTGGSGVDSTFILPTVVVDRAGSYNSTTGEFTAGSAGDYELGGILFTTNNSVTIRGFVDGSFVSNVGYINGNVTALSGVFPMLAGQKLTVRSLTNAGASAGNSVFTFKKLANPQTIAASEVVKASYWLSSNLAMTAGTTILNYDSKEIDNFSCVEVGSSWKFRSKDPRLYLVSGVWSPQAGANAVLYKNGSAYKAIGGGTAAANSTFSTLIQLNSGEYFDIRTNVSHTHTGGALATATTANINIVSVGF